MSTRMYVVKTPTGENLVEASNPSQAIRAVVTAGVTCEAASSKDVFRLMQAGAKVIDGTKAAEPAPAAA